MGNLITENVINELTVVSIQHKKLGNQAHSIDHPSNRLENIGIHRYSIVDRADTDLGGIRVSQHHQKIARRRCLHASVNSGLRKSDTYLREQKWCMSTARNRTAQSNQSFRYAVVTHIKISIC